MGGHQETVHFNVLSDSGRCPYIGCRLGILLMCVFVYSAFDLQYVILHKGLVPPSTFGEGVIMCFPGKV